MSARPKVCELCINTEDQHNSQSFWMLSILIENSEVWQYGEKLEPSLLAFRGVSGIANICLASICYHGAVSVCFGSCVISAIPVQTSWMIYSLLKWHWAPVLWTGILAFTLWISTLLKGHNNVVMATAKHGSSEQVGQFFKQVCLCNNYLQLIKAGCGLSPTASCLGWEWITCGVLHFPEQMGAVGCRVRNYGKGYNV